jgi:hypothetical protein
MKILNKSILIMLYTIFTATASFAQQAATKQKLFAAFPETISLSKTIITEAFSYSTGALI